MMSRTDTALDVPASTRAGTFGEDFGFARSGRDGDTVYVQTRGRTGTAFINGLCKILLTLAVLGLVAIGGVLAFNTLGQTPVAPPVEATSANDRHAREIGALRSEVAALTEQGLALRTDLALLTGQGGVLPKLIARLQDQRRVNGAHSNAIRQLYATTGLIGASLPLADEASTSESAGSRPVQVTPVAAPVADSPQRVVLIPEQDAGAGPNTEGGDGE